MKELYLYANTPSGDVYATRIANAKGEFVEILNYGSVIRRICVKDRLGVLRDVALGYDRIEQYNNRGTYFGALVGQVANRISGCAFSLLGKEYRLFDTGGGVSLHGGKTGFNNRIFKIIDDERSGDSVTLELTSENGDEGYPGGLKLAVKYTFTADSNLIIDYTATTDAPTVFNPTNHTYFNLCGHDSGKTIYDTLLQINASYVTPLGGDFTPTGEFQSVEGTPFDFRNAKKIGRDIDANDPQLRFAGGYDINYVLDTIGAGSLSKRPLPGNFSGLKPVEGLANAAIASSEESGICLLAQTDRPCMQLYSGNFIEKTAGKNGAT